VPRLTPAPEEPSAVAGALGDHGWSQLDIPVLGTVARLAVRGGGPGLLIDAQGLLEDLDRRWNPARPESLIAQIEAGGGDAVPVDDETFALVEASVAAAEQTDGAVGSEGLDLNALLTRVGAPVDAVFDVDDLARARTADLVAEALVDAGADGAVVDVEGVLRLAGTVADGSAWLVTVPHPDTPEDPDTDLATLGIAEGACATILRPTRDLLAITVLAPDAMAAVVLAASGDPALLTASDLPGLVFAADGRDAQRIGPVGDFLR
jgi:thiamine biosynthesis lipoprotein